MILANYIVLFYICCYFAKIYLIIFFFAMEIRNRVLCWDGQIIVKTYRISQKYRELCSWLYGIGSIVRGVFFKDS